MSKTTVGIGVHATMNVDDFNEAVRRAVKQVGRLPAATQRAERGMQKSTKRMGFAMQQLGFGVEDFLTQYGTMGFAGGLRAAGNNISMFAAQINPLAGVVAGVGTALTAMFLNIGNAAEKAAEKQNALKESIDSIKKALTEAGEQAAFEKALQDIMTDAAAGRVKPGAANKAIASMAKEARANIDKLAIEQTAIEEGMRRREVGLGNDIRDRLPFGESGMPERGWVSDPLTALMDMGLGLAHRKEGEPLFRAQGNPFGRMGMARKWLTNKGGVLDLAKEHGVDSDARDRLTREVNEEERNRHRMLNELDQLRAKKEARERELERRGLTHDQKKSWLAPFEKKQEELEKRIRNGAGRLVDSLVRAILAADEEVQAQQKRLAEIKAKELPRQKSRQEALEATGMAEEKKVLPPTPPVAAIEFMSAAENSLFASLQRDGASLREQTPEAREAMQAMKRRTKLEKEAEQAAEKLKKAFIDLSPAVRAAKKRLRDVEERRDKLQGEHEGWTAFLEGFIGRGPASEFMPGGELPEGVPNDWRNPDFQWEGRNLDQTINEDMPRATRELEEALKRRTEELNKIREGNDNRNEELKKLTEVIDEFSQRVKNLDIQQFSFTGA